MAFVLGDEPSGFCERKEYIGRPRNYQFGGWRVLEEFV